MLSARLLLVHRTVVAQGTLTAAAETLGYTVSAVSHQLAQLEAEAGSVLYEKAGRGVRPTAAGLLLAGHADRVLGAVRDAEVALADLRAGRTGRVRLVSFFTAGESLVPAAVVGLRARMPQVHVIPSVDNTEGAMRRLRAGEVDLVIVEEPFGPGEQPQDDIHRTHLLDDEYRLLLPQEHRLARRRVIDLTALADDPWIVTTPPVGLVREVTELACRRAGFTPQVVAEGDEFALTQGYVAAGLGVAIAPMLALGAVRDRVAVRRMRTPPPPRHIWLATRMSTAGEPAVRELIAQLQQAAAGAAAARR